MDCDDTIQGRYFHTQIAHVDGCIELVYEPSTEDGIIWIVEIDHVKGYILCSRIFLTSKGCWERACAAYWSLHCYVIDEPEMIFLLLFCLELH